MAITALGLGTKQAPENVNLDPQRQFWSFLTAFLARGNEGYDTATSEFGWLNGFNCRQASPAGMSIQIGGGTDAAVLHTYASAGNAAAYLLSTDGAPEIVTIPTAPASGSRIDAVVSYIDTSQADPETETPGTPEYVHTIVVSGTAAGSPTSPTNAQIAEALPATAAGKRFIRWCDVTVAAKQTVITNSDIKSYKPNAPYVYWSTSDFNNAANSRINALVPNMIVQRAPYVANVRKTGTNPAGGPYRINAPAARAGYKFLCWTTITTEKYVAQWNPDNPDAPDPLLHCAADRGGSGTIVAQALYVPIS